MALPRQWWNPGWGVKVWLMVAFMVLPTLGFAVWVLLEAGGESPIDPAILALAEANAGGPVIAISGTEHTSYHSPGPLPTAGAPREDGRLALVWFTSPSCRACAELSFVHSTMVDYREEIVTFEKSVDRDTSDERLGVSEVPAFVLLDADGGEIDRLVARDIGLSEPGFREWLGAATKATRAAE